MAKAATFRLMLAMIKTLKLHLHQMDVDSAFSYADFSIFKQASSSSICFDFDGFYYQTGRRVQRHLLIVLEQIIKEQVLYNQE